FVWSGPGTGTILPGLGAQPEFSGASGINNKGQIVGGSIATNGFFTSAVLWENGKIFDLNTLIGPYNGWFLSAAYDINDEGEIVGFGTFAVNPTGPFLGHAFLLKPI